MESNFQNLLRSEGYYNKWHAQVMSDILLPLIQVENPPQLNGALQGVKNCGEHTLSLYLIREVFRNLGLTSTEKIFAEEAELDGSELRFQEALKDEFGAFALSTKNHLLPPVLLQLLYFILRHYRHKKQACQ